MRRLINVAMTMVVLSAATVGMATSASAGSAADDGATATWNDTSLKVPTLSCFDVPITVTVPTADGNLYHQTYFLVTTAAVPEQEVAFGATAFYMGGDPMFPRTPTGPTRTLTLNICTDKLTSGLGPYKVWFADTSGDLLFFKKGAVMLPAEQRAIALSEGTVSRITFNDGSVAPPATPVVKKITCKKKSTGVVKRFARKQCPSGWVRIRR